MNKLQNTGFTNLAKIVLALASAACILPFILLFVTSVTDENYLVKYGYTFFPSSFSLSAYQYLWERSEMITRAYGITVFVTAIGTTACLIITSMLAYPLSRKELPGQRVLLFIVLFTILFNGGLVPTYILYTHYINVKNTIWSLILPRLLLSGFNIFIMRSFFRTNVPPALIESAYIDGAGEFRIFYKIILPLSLPIMATIGLMSGLAYWNDWFNGLIYLTDPNLYSLQVVLNQILMNVQYLASSTLANNQAGTADIPSISVRMAIAAIGVLPILMIYPFFQKYFIKGITIGAVKG